MKTSYLYYEEYNLHVYLRETLGRAHSLGLLMGAALSMPTRKQRFS